MILSIKPLEIAQLTVPLIGSALVVTSLAYSPRTVTGLIVPIGLLLIFFHLLGIRRSRLFRSLVSPFLPLVLVSLAVAPFQETISEALALVAIAVVYVLARLLRLVVPVTWLLFGVSVAGFVTGLVRQLSLTPLAERLPLLEKVAEIQDRNPAGTATAFAAVALLILTSGISNPRSLRTLFDTWLLITGFLMIVSDVMTGVIGSLAAAGGLAVMAVVVSVRAKSNVIIVRRKFWLSVLSAISLSAGLVALANLASQSNLASSDNPLQRNFGNLTGRTQIWTCYADIVRRGLPDPWLETLECTGYNHANLHNTYLQAHLLAGIPGILAAGFAFLVSIFIGLSLTIRAKNNADLKSGLASLGIGVLAAVFALTESYLFVYLYPTIVVFMFAPEMRVLPRRMTKLALQGKKTA